MALFLTTTCPSSLQQRSFYFSGRGLKKTTTTTTTRASCFFNPAQEPLLKQALKEPVAFMGGMFAGLLRLDLNEDPLKDWVSRTVEASSSSVTTSATQEDEQHQHTNDQESPQQIEIE